jgi:hypothetical protein
MIPSTSFAVLSNLRRYSSSSETPISLALFIILTHSTGSAGAAIERTGRSAPHRLRIRSLRFWGAPCSVGQS